MDPTALVDALKLAPAAAIEYLKKKGMAISPAWTDLWREAHAKAFTVAGVMKMDLLEDIRQQVQSALDNGTTLREFKKNLVPRLQADGWLGEILDDNGKVTAYANRRLNTIYGTNLQTAYMAGRYKGQMQARRVRPYGQYVAIIDGSTTDRCRTLHGKVFRLDDPVWDNLYPPNHWGCRSRVRTLSERQVLAKGIKVETGEGNLVTKQVGINTPQGPQVVPVTGLKTTTGDGQPITYWPDPGWDYNPGKVAFKPDLNKYSKDIAARFQKDRKK